MIDPVDLRNRFKHHPPSTNEVINAHQTIRNSCLDLADLVNELIPDSREKSLAITHLEEVMMWANAAIARTQLVG